MDRRQVLLSIGLVGSSGCLRLTTSGKSSPTETTTAESPIENEPETETKPETETEKSEAPSYPIGLSDRGADATLFSAQVRTLALTSFRSRWTKFDATDGHVKWQKEYEAADGTVLGRWSRRDGGSVTIHRSSRGGYWREELDDGVTYGRDNRNLNLSEAMWGIEIEPLLRAGDWNEPVLAERAEPAIWEVTTSTVDDAAAIPGHHEGEVVSISSATMRVDENGVIRSVEATYRIRNAANGGETRDYAIEYAVDSLGDVSVAEPSWLSTAEERTPVASASLTDDGFVRFVIESGNRIEAESRLSVFDQDGPGKTVVELDEPIEVGNPAYLYKERPKDGIDGFWWGGISRGAPPTDTPAEPFEGSYELGAFRRATMYFESIDVTEP